MQPRYRRLLDHARVIVRLYTPDDLNTEHLAHSQSAAYYAVFRALSEHCADILVPHKQGVAQGAAWTRFYRALNHSVFNKGAMAQHRKELPADMMQVMTIGAQLKRKRASADYNPNHAATAQAALEAPNWPKSP